MQIVQPPGEDGSKRRSVCGGRARGGVGGGGNGLGKGDRWVDVSVT